MSITKIKDRYQVTIPKDIRRELGCNVGDLLEVGIQDGQVVLTPQKIVRKPSIAKLTVEEQRILQIVQEKLDDIGKDSLNSKGLNKQEIEVGIKVGLIDSEEAWWYEEKWQKEARNATRDEYEDNTSEVFEKDGLMKHLKSIRKK